MKTDWMKTFAEFVRTYRLKMGLSQVELAAITKMNTSYISRLENGKDFKSVKVDFLVLLSQAFDMPTQEIMKSVGLEK